MLTKSTHFSVVCIVCCCCCSDFLTRLFESCHRSSKYCHHNKCLSYYSYIMTWSFHPFHSKLCFLLFFALPDGCDDGISSISCSGTTPTTIINRVSSAYSIPRSSKTVVVCPIFLFGMTVLVYARCFLCTVERLYSVYFATLKEKHIIATV